MKAMSKRLSKEGVEKGACIKRQQKHIAKLMKKMEKGTRVSSNKSASSDEDEKGSN